MSTGNDLLRFHLPHQRYLQENVNVCQVKYSTLNEGEITIAEIIMPCGYQNQNHAIECLFVFLKLLILAIQIVKVVELMAWLPKANINYFRLKLKFNISWKKHYICIFLKIMHYFVRNLCFCTKCTYTYCL